MEGWALLGGTVDEINLYFMQSLSMLFSWVYSPRFRLFLHFGHCISFLGLPYTIPQIEYLKTTEVYSLTVLEAKGLKSRGQQGHAFW